MVSEIKALCQRYNTTIKSVEEALGLGNGTIRRWDKHKPTVENALAVAQYFGVSIEYLLGIDTPVISDPVSARYNKLDEHGKSVVEAVLGLEEARCGSVIDYGTIRKYLSRPAAGVGGMTAGEDYEDVPRTAETPKAADFALVVSGDSMEPYIHDGETVYIDEKAPLREMDVCVFAVDGVTYVKQYAPAYNGDLYLLSANPARESANITIKKDGGQSVQYFGKVILKKRLPPPVYKK